ncbi:hypothetical protein FB382_001328 [Nocardioides ginsengisegetis]|uniref:SipW-cognate class signal peptide n=1 Tax=Nocardioides ginsengisegetis TaxID=661491 RepID=A0A7W3P939_9ACTN|nr:hypothetical protein [Nocardioides ginsengisegetis]MBA8803037.1 hypothetical protein [Nocardioides ginsengisegetis]
MGRPRFLPGVWAVCAVSAMALALSVNGTLSSWTSAVVSNDANTAATATAVILKESSGGVDCYSSTNATNSSTCTTINVYGGTATPLTPGGSQTMDVTFTNVGAAAATSFSVAPGSCTQLPVAGTGTPAVANVCTNGDLTVAISCSPGTSYSSGSAWTDLVQSAVAPASIGATLTHTGAIAANGSATCHLTVALSATANVLDQAVTVTQPMTWTMVK